MNSRVDKLAWAVPLIAAVLAHITGLLNGFTNWDDPLYLINNPLTVTPLSQGWWHLLTTPEIDYAIPVTVLAYAGERAIFGLSPAAFHGVSLVLHAAVALLSYGLARRLGVGRWAAAAGAAFFAVHPVTVEPVAWVVGQKDLLIALFVLIAAHVRVRSTSAAASAAVVLLLTLAMGSKPSAVASPLVIVALDWCLGRRLRAPRNLLVYCSAFAVALVATWVAVVGHSDLEHPATIGAATIAHAGWAAALQIGHVIAPNSLSAAYYPPEGTEYAVYVVLGFVFTVVVGLLLRTLYSKGEKVAVFSLAAAVACYLPVSGIVKISRGPADSYLYASLALLVPAIALGWTQVWQRYHKRAAQVIAAIIVTLALVSAMRTRVWDNAEWLWEDVLVQYPDEPTAYMRFGNALQYNKKMKASLEVFEEIEERWPDHASSRIDHAFSLDALGRVLEAERQFAKGARLGKTPFYRNYYSSYLVGHPGLPPSDPVLAEEAIAELAPKLIADNAPMPIRLRAAELLETGGQHSNLVQALRAEASSPAPSR